MNPKDAHLGAIVRDTISGFAGVVVAITDWLNGCRRVTVQPKELKDGLPVDNRTFDVEQLENVKPTTADIRPSHGGPRIEPTPRESPKR